MPRTARLNFVKLRRWLIALAVLGVAGYSARRLYSALSFYNGADYLLLPPFTVNTLTTLLEWSLWLSAGLTGLLALWGLAAPSARFPGAARRLAICSAGFLLIVLIYPQQYLAGTRVEPSLRFVINAGAIGVSLLLWLSCAGLATDSLLALLFRDKPRQTP